MPYVLIFDSIEECNKAIEKLSRDEFFMVQMKYTDEDKIGMF